MCPVSVALGRCRYRALIPVLNACQLLALWHLPVPSTSPGLIQTVQWITIGVIATTGADCAVVDQAQKPKTRGSGSISPVPEGITGAPKSSCLSHSYNTPWVPTDPLQSTWRQRGRKAGNNQGWFSSLCILKPYLVQSGFSLSSGMLTQIIVLELLEPSAMGEGCPFLIFCCHKQLSFSMGQGHSPCFITILNSMGKSKLSHG